MRVSYTYRWLHLPTGKTGVKVGEFTTPLSFYKALGLWNRMGAGKWLYTEEGWDHV